MIYKLNKGDDMKKTTKDKVKVTNMEKATRDETKLTKNRIVKDLQKGNIKVTFIKKDGDIRTLHGTLNIELMERSKSWEEPKGIRPHTSLDSVTCWDIEKEAWRRFRIDSIIEGGYHHTVGIDGIKYKDEINE